MDEVEIKGGGELQRCLYAFAVKTLLCSKVEVDAALLFPRAADEGQALFRLSDVDGALQKLANAIDLARKNLISGLALPGIDAADQYNDFAFLLPAAANYLPRKLPLAAEKLGEATAIWEAK
jgi:hypothetical protein